MKYVKWFNELSKEDIGVAGGKGANLGELTQAGIPVPPGFVLTSQAYFAFLEHNRLRPQIHRLLVNCDINDAAQLNQASTRIRRHVSTGSFPSEITHEIFTAYQQLPARHALVAVRSSATAEDLPDASFAGQQESFLNVSGEANLILKIRGCYESLFGPRSIFYRAQKKYDHFKVGIAVPVQIMVQSEVSGVMFTVDPISIDKDRLIIEAAYGLGDYVVQGVVTPDHYEVSKAQMSIINKQLSHQEIKEVRSPTGVRQAPVPARLQDAQKLTDAKILELAQLGKKIHHHYYFPQDIEWALEKDKLYITQSRPITTLNDQKSTIPQTHLSLLGPPILKGAPASPGVVTGPVKMIKDTRHLDRIKSGDVLVTEMTTPDFVPAMKRAAAIVTDKGGLTSHAAIVSRELGVPCIVGTSTATHVLKDGMIITIDGQSGDVYAGSLPRSSVTVLFPPGQPSLATTNLKTATKLYVNLAEIELAEKIAKQHVDGVGLLRAEFMIAGLGIHPKKVIAEGSQKQYIEKLASDMATFCRAFYPRPVIYRATDFKTNEYRSLKGGDRYEPVESNPMLGFRGAYRYIKTPDVFNLELEAIKLVRHKKKLTNLWLMIPFVSTVDEMVEVKKIVAASGLHRSSTFKLFMMVEIPANVILLDEFIDTGIDGVSIGSNDLTMLILGIDRDNNDVAPNFDERNPAVMWALEKTVTTCAKRNVMCGICGQAPSQYPEIVEKLVSWGITSISVNPDAIARTREIIYYSEKKLIASKVAKSHGQT